MSLPNLPNDKEPNDASHTGAYGTTEAPLSVFVFSADGGFTMERGFEDIKRADQTAPDYVDVTDSVQVTMSAEIFNGKLGSYTTSSDSFANDSIEISAAEFALAVDDATKVISVGKYTTLYSNFQAYVAAYFGVEGFETLFAAASEFNINTGNVFGGAELVALMTAETEDAETGAYLSGISGSITIDNIAKLLRYAVDGNVFGNRDPALPSPDGTDWGVATGFRAGDLIWVEEGMTIVLKLAIDEEAFAPLNNVGTTKGASLISTQDIASGMFSTVTEASTVEIKRTAKAPLLIKLV